MAVIYLHTGTTLEEAYAVMRRLLDAERDLNVRFQIKPLGAEDTGRHHAR